MEQSPSWEANSHPSDQEIPLLLCSPKVHYRVHKSPPIPKRWVTFRTSVFIVRSFYPSVQPPQAGGPLLVGCLRLLMRYIHRYPPYPPYPPTVCYYCSLVTLLHRPTQEIWKILKTVEAQMGGSGFCRTAVSETVTDVSEEISASIFRAETASEHGSQLNLYIYVINSDRASFSVFFTAF
jgi:hypothetical protein